MAPRTLWRLCLLACFLMIDAARSASPPPAAATAEKGKACRFSVFFSCQTPPGSGRRRSLPAPLIGDDGRLIACSGKDLLAFEPNGSAAWTAPLGHQCNQSIRPVTEGRKVYLVAEDKIIKVTTPDNVGGARPASKVFFSYNATEGRSEEIIGISISGEHSTLFVTIRNRGLFVLSLLSGPQWSLGPVFDRAGYRQGCKGNVSTCYFNSAPVVDPCNGALYISNTEGELYSLRIHSRQFAWIKDLSSLDKLMTIAPGNSGRLYILFPTKSIVVGLDVLTGNISWQRNIGWMSIGSLDGNLYSISPDGDIRKFLQKAANDSAIHTSPVLDCSGFSMYVAQTIVGGKSIHKNGDYTHVSAMKKNPKRVLFTLLTPATETIYWTGEYPGNLSNLLSSRDLNDFGVDETILLSILSASRIGNTTMQCYTRRKKIGWTCGRIKAKFAETNHGDNDLRGLMIVYFLVIVMEAVAFCSCCIFWRKKKVQGKGLHKFLEKRCSLHKKRIFFGKMISHLEQTAAEDSDSNETLVRLGEMVKAKEGVEKKLYSSYSLGRDPLGLKQDSSVLPQYNGKYKSHSFHSSQKESITIFNTFSDTSASEDGTTSSYSDDSASCSCSSTSSEDMELDPVSRSVEEAGPSDTANVADAMFVGGQSRASSGDALSQREGMIVTLKDYTPSKRTLKRRRTFN
ncbi:hypothetical protein EJB05_50765, partial [Eragrostis curvula]